MFVKHQIPLYSFDVLLYTWISILLLNVWYVSGFWNSFVLLYNPFHRFLITLYLSSLCSQSTKFHCTLLLCKRFSYIWTFISYLKVWVVSDFGKKIVQLLKTLYLSYFCSPSNKPHYSFDVLVYIWTFISYLKVWIVINFVKNLVWLL